MAVTLHSGSINAHTRRQRALLTSLPAEHGSKGGASRFGASPAARLIAGAAAAAAASPPETETDRHLRRSRALLADLRDAVEGK